MTLVAPLRVLVADDQDDVRLLARMLLDQDRRFCVVGEARDGSEAVDLARTLVPDVVLLDIDMPVLDGIAALPLLHASVPAVRVVVFTAFDHLRHDALGEGATAVLEKASVAGDLADELFAALNTPLTGPNDARPR